MKNIQNLANRTRSHVIGFLKPFPWLDDDVNMNKQNKQTKNAMNVFAGTQNLV